MKTATITNSKKESVNVFALIAAYYSHLLEEEITIPKAKALVMAQCAFIAFIMPFEMGWAYRVVALAWFFTSLLRCKCIMNCKD